MLCFGLLDCIVIRDGLIRLPFDVAAVDHDYGFWSHWDRSTKECKRVPIEWDRISTKWDKASIEWDVDRSVFVKKVFLWVEFEFPFVWLLLNFIGAFGLFLAASKWGGILNWSRSIHFWNEDDKQQRLRVLVALLLMGWMREWWWDGWIPISQCGRKLWTSLIVVDGGVGFMGAEVCIVVLCARVCQITFQSGRILPEWALALSELFCHVFWEAENGVCGGSVLAEAFLVKSWCAFVFDVIEELWCDCSFKTVCQWLGRLIWQSRVDRRWVGLL